MDSRMEWCSRELGKAGSFDQALDILAQITADMGYTQVLYAYQRTARLADGEWVPLKLNVRNFPAGWEHQWEAFGSHDPYYRACFETTLPFDWHDVQRREHLHPAQAKAWRYLADLGLGRGMTIPVHLPWGRFAVVSAIVDRSTSNWSHVRDSTRDTMFHLTHLFHDTVRRNEFEDQVQVASYIRLSPREPSACSGRRRARPRPRSLESSTDPWKPCASTSRTPSTSSVPTTRDTLSARPCNSDWSSQSTGTDYPFMLT